MNGADTEVEQWSRTLVDALRRGGDTLQLSGSLFCENARRFASDIEGLMSEGNELIAWDNLEHRHRPMPEEAVLEAVERLASRDTAKLVALLSESNDTFAIHTCTCRLSSINLLGPAWLRTPSSTKIAALGLVRWLRWIAEQARKESTENQGAFIAAALTTVADALWSRPRQEEVDLWWQALGMVYRLCPAVRGDVSPFYALLYEIAAKSLGRNGGADAVPDEERVRRRENTGNRLVRAVLPHVATHVDAVARQSLIATFFRDVERRLEGEQHEMPDVEEQGGLFYVNACGLAIELEERDGRGMSWWEKKTWAYCSALEGWKGDPSAVAMERAAWLGCAACIAAIRLARTGGDWHALATAVFRLGQRHLEDWMWELGTPSSAREAFPVLLVRVASIEQPIDGARVLSIAKEIHDARVLKEVQELVGRAMDARDADELRRLVDERAAYEASLG